MAMICVSGGKECDGCMACREPLWSGGRRSRYRGKKGCTLPSDYLTEEELHAKNGPIITWRPDRQEEP